MTTILKSLDSVIDKADAKVLRAVLKGIVGGSMTPAFGALSKKEMDLLLLDALVQIGYLDENLELYSMLRKLQITKGKARNLLYERELRLRSDAELDAAVCLALQRPLLQKQGDLFCLEIENPLVADHVRQLLKELGHATDGSFSPAVIRIRLDAAAALIERMTPISDRDAITAAFVAAGAPEKTFKGVLRGALLKFAGKLAGAAGEAIADEVASLIAPVLDGAAGVVEERARILFLSGQTDPGPNTSTE